MRVVTAAAMRELDRRTIEELGIPGAVLMENAGRGATQVLLRRFSDLGRGPVAVVCGAGNNGGDGFVVARCLRERRVEVKVFLLAEPDRLRGDARIYFDVMRRLGVPLEVLTGEEIPDPAQAYLRRSTCIVDAIFGTGLARDVEGRYARAIQSINAARRPVLALDIPSGVCSDTGRVLGVAVRAAWTPTFGVPKRGLYLHPGAGLAGAVECVEIGIPQAFLEEVEPVEEIREPDAFRAYASREPDTHKGTYGHLLVLAGSAGKTGAAVLCAEAALRCGAGLVTLGIPETLNAVLEEKLTEVMTVPLPDTGTGMLSGRALDRVLELAESLDGVAVGPGLGIDEATDRITRELWTRCHKPMVWDADALTLVAAHPDLKGRQKGRIVVTPHPGEMGRLIGRSAAWVQQDRVGVARAFSRDWHVVTVLKGARTLVTDPGGRLCINVTGNPGMATGGMGDVLTGMIGGLLVQGIDPYEASAFGAWMHGSAGDHAAREIGPLGFLAKELLGYLPRIFAELTEGTADP